MKLMRMTDGRAVVSGVSPDGQAAVAGVREGDIIESFAGAHMTYDECLTTLKTQPRPLEITLVRENPRAALAEQNPMVSQTSRGGADGRRRSSGEQQYGFDFDFDGPEAKNLSIMNVGDGVTLLKATVTDLMTPKGRKLSGTVYGVRSTRRTSIVFTLDLAKSVNAHISQPAHLPIQQPVVRRCESNSTAALALVTAQDPTQPCKVRAGSEWADDLSRSSSGYS